MKRIDWFTTGTLALYTLNVMRPNITIACFLMMFCSVSCFLPGRDGKKIYSDFFGKATDTCLQILESRDARALDDCCVWLHFKVCPEETKRLLLLVPYEVETLTKALMELEFPDPASIDESMISADPPKWWTLKKLGDSCLKFKYFHPDKDYAQFVYVSFDSTEVFYHDASW